MIRYIAVCGLLIGTLVHAQALPDDSQKYYLITVSADPPSAASNALALQLVKHPQLSKIARACKMFQFKSTDEIYKARYAAQLPATDLPVIALARSDGGVLYKASGKSIPDPDSIAKAMTEIATADRAANQRMSMPVYGNDFVATRPHLVPGHDGHFIPDTIVARLGFSMMQFLMIGGFAILVMFLLFVIGGAAVFLLK